MRIDFKIGEKFLVAGLLPLVFLIGIGFWNGQRVHSIGATIRQMQQDEVSPLLSIDALRDGAGALRQHLSALAEGAGGVEGGLGEAERHARTFRSEVARLRDAWSARSGLQNGNEIKAVEQQFEAAYTLGMQMARTALQEGADAARPLQPAFHRAADTLQNSLSTLSREPLQRLEGQTEAVQGQLLALHRLILGLSAAALLSGGLLILLLVRTSNRRAGAILTALAAIAGGNLATRVKIPGVRNEFSRIGAECNRMTTTLEQVMRIMGLHAGSITASAGELIKIRDLVNADADNSKAIVGEVTTQNTLLNREITEVKDAIQLATNNLRVITASSAQVSQDVISIAAGAEQTSVNITTVASAAEEITANISGVNNSLEQVDSAVQTVASSVQEVNLALGEVRLRCQAASRESEQANQHAQGSRELMKKLSTSAREIGQVVEVITDIAEKTNMLSLNAAIEAAGAGAAGRGFAVVAVEVKDLARQTAEATHMIHKKILEIQTNAQAVATANGEIVNSVARINQANLEITYSVDEQTATIRNIAQSMQHVAEAAGEVTLNARELNQAATDVARAASEAAAGTSEVARSASEVAKAAEQVAEESHKALELADTILQSAGQTTRSSLVVQEKMEEARHTVQLMKGSALYFGRLGTVMQNMSNALYATQLELEIGAPLFNIRDIKDEFLHRLGLLEQLLHERLEPHAVSLSEERSSTYGQWRHSVKGQAMQSLPVVQEVDRLHRLLHDDAAQILQSVARGELAEGAQGLERFHQHLPDFFQMLDFLYLGEDPALPPREFFPWNDALMTGVAFVDNDHKKLVAMVNDFHHAMKRGHGSDVVNKILAGLVEYTQFHFGREETAMGKHGYPDFPGHKKQHEELIATVSTLVGQFQAGRFTVGIDLLAAAKNWLVWHIMGTDRAFTPFLRSKGVNETP